ncbi:hypothetical protein BDZ89DRAFT_1062873, partial [Hymenopellis radicata]
MTLSSVGKRYGVYTPAMIPRSTCFPPQLKKSESSHEIGRHAKNLSVLEYKRQMFNGHGPKMHEVIYKKL